MDLKPIVAKLAADCDLRTRFVRSVPGALDNYYLSESGQLMTRQELDKAYPITFLWDGLDLVVNSIRS